MIRKLIQFIGISIVLMGAAFVFGTKVEAGPADRCEVVEGIQTCELGYSLQRESLAGEDKICVNNLFSPFIGQLVRVSSDNQEAEICAANPTGVSEPSFRDTYMQVKNPFSFGEDINNANPAEYRCCPAGTTPFTHNASALSGKTHFCCPSNVTKVEASYGTMGRFVGLDQRIDSLSEGFVINRRNDVTIASLTVLGTPTGFTEIARKPACYLPGENAPADEAVAETRSLGTYEPIKRRVNEQLPDGTVMFKEPQPGYACPSEPGKAGCRVVRNGVVLSIDNRTFGGASAENDCNDKLEGCYADGEALPAGLGGFCNNGRRVEENPDDIRCEGNPLLDQKTKEACKNLLDPEEFKNCIRCECTGVDAVWTQIGCVEATSSGVITRIFQIAIGIMGAVIIFRIIQIMVILNNPDPNTDRVAEAREIAVSLVVFAIFLGGCIILLRYLGYNVIGINVPIFGGE